MFKIAVAALFIIKNHTLSTNSYARWKKKHNTFINANKRYLDTALSKKMKYYIHDQCALEYQSITPSFYKAPTKPPFLDSTPLYSFFHEAKSEEGYQPPVWILAPPPFSWKTGFPPPMHSLHIPDYPQASLLCRL